MKTTQNYGLRKPEPTDFYNVDDFNFNADVIDTELFAVKQKADQTESDLAAHLNESAQDDAHPGLAEMWNARIVEMGENANGTYIRWENGLQVCFADHDIIRWNPQTSPNEGLNNAYYTTHLIWVYPASFIDPPVISWSIEHAGSGNLWGLSVVYTAGILEGSCDLWLWTEHAREHESYGTAAAIGRWK